MFNPGKKNHAATGKREHSKEYAVTIITNGCHFSGKLYCKGSTRIGGRVDGEIISEGLLIIEEEATICADVKAEDIVIQGHLRGTVEAHGKVELSPSCIYEGDIITPILVMQEGAQFNGRATMDHNRMMDRTSNKESTHTYPTSLLSSHLDARELDRIDLNARVPEINADL